MEHGVSLAEDLEMYSKLKKSFQAKVATIIIFNYSQEKKNNLGWLQNLNMKL